jgi:hypothetical protein
MGDGTKEKPYTRRDVLRRIKANGGTAEGLDLSGKVFEREIDLHGLNLEGIILKGADLEFTHLEGARLVVAHLEGADLSNTHLEGAVLGGTHLEEADLGGTRLEGAYLAGAHLEGAGLMVSNLEGADLSGAHLEGAYLWNAEFDDDTKLEDVDWGNYILGEEKYGAPVDVVATYRRLKRWYTNAGMYDIAGKFFYREMEARRKALSWKKKPLYKLWHSALRLLCGYGEQWWRVVGWAATVVVGLAVIYYLWGSFSSSSFWDTLYYSAASFTALGYGSWAPQPTGWAKGMGAAEAFIGVFSMALFLVTFTRKMTR